MRHKVGLVVFNAAHSTSQLVRDDVAGYTGATDVGAKFVI
jgi:hypothetical protein